MAGYDPEAELMSDRRDFRAEMTAARLEIARLQAEVERLNRALEVSERGSLGNKLQREVAQAQRDRSWNDAIEAAASVCDSKSGTPMDVNVTEYYTALGYELAAEDIRALKRT